VDAAPCPSAGAGWGTGAADAAAPGAVATGADPAVPGSVLPPVTSPPGGGGVGALEQAAGATSAAQHNDDARTNRPAVNWNEALAMVHSPFDAPNLYIV
jgi:hypothetical protein